MTDNILDSRDLIQQFEELHSEFDALKEQLDEAADDPVAYADAVEDLSSFDNEEYERLKAICEKGENYFSDWRYGVELILDSYFETYAKELADNIGALKRDLSWPYTCIDWERAANELKMDYTSIEIDGHTYWGR